jgi:2,4-didehydro-3-deoxy-L-rhamnonate hydrolase
MTKSFSGNSVMNSLTHDGDVTGTAAGVGLGMKLPQYLKGDVVELEIEGLGDSRQRVVNFSEQRYSKTV